jgi:Septum formation
MSRAGWARLGRATALVLATLALAGCRSATPPTALGVGDCFDIPAATERIEDVGTRSCSGPHGGEVFHVFDDAAPGAATYPTDPEWGERIYPICDPVFETYTGTPVADRTDIDYRYLVPTPDRWSAGDRQVTCFIIEIDGGSLDRSFRAAP